MEQQQFSVPAALHGQRLDKALELLLPHCGVRARRRLWDTTRILVNDTARPKGYTVVQGDVVSLVPLAPLAPLAPLTQDICPTSPMLQDHANAFAPPCPQRPHALVQDVPRLVQTQGELSFVYKPAGMHSTAQAGSTDPVPPAPLAQASFHSLEQCLPALLPPHWGDAAPLLCNRLDQGTSGLVVVAKNEQALADWRRLEDEGLCEKLYVALVHGHMRESMTVPLALNTHRRKISLVQPHSAPPLRHTRFEPLGMLDAISREALAAFFPLLTSQATPADIATTDTGDANILSFVGCLIRKGARHQIRAHAAHLWHPLWHDVRYTERRVPQEGETFVLHHGLLRIPGLSVHCQAVWQKNLSQKIHNNIANWLECSG